MAKEILLYSGIYSFTAETFIEKMEEAKGEDVVLRINTPGGDPQAGFGMIAKFAEHEGNKLIKVDGKANSMGAFFLSYAEEVEVLDVSEIVVHRAAYPAYFEAREGFKSSEEYKSLEKVNKSLRSGLESKIDVEKFEAVAKVTLDEVFSMDSRIDVSLTPKQAKQIGLISKIKKLTSEMSAEIHSNGLAMAASYGVEITEAPKAENPEVENSKSVNLKTNIKMTIEKLKAENPEVFAQAVKMGISQERTRVEAILVFNEVDAEACKSKIESGEDLDQKFTATMQLKAMKATVAEGAEEEGAEGVDQGAEEENAETAEAKRLSDFEAKLDVELKK